MVRTFDDYEMRSLLHLSTMAVLYTACLTFDQSLWSCLTLFAGGQQFEVSLGLRERTLTCETHQKRRDSRGWPCNRMDVPVGPESAE